VSQRLALFYYMNNLLNIEERNELERCEVVIKQGLKTFVEVGQALMLIRDKKLYRSEFGTFESYCQEKWQLTRRHVNRLVGSSQVISNLGPIGPKPQTESQARPLTKLEPELQSEAWQKTVEQHGENITQKKVEEVVKEFVPINNELKQAKKEPMFAASSQEELLKKAKEVAKERAAEKRQKIDEKGSTPDIPQEDKLLIEKIDKGETVVLNMNTNFHAMKYAKDKGLFVRIDRFSAYGNPFVLGQDGNRNEVCDKYAIYFGLKTSLHEQVKELKGKVLGCHCYPKRCHGEHLKEVADV
jgi:hypothetical protein